MIYISGNMVSMIAGLSRLWTMVLPCLRRGGRCWIDEDQTG